MAQGLFLNYVYIVLDVIMLVLGLLFVAKWGKRGLLALTLWLFVIGLMALTAGDMLATLSENYGTDFVLNEGTYYEVSSTDFAYIPAVIIWIVAFIIPIKFAFFDAKKAQSAEQPPPNMAQAGAPPAGAPPAGTPPQQPQAQSPAPPQQPGAAPSANVAWQQPVPPPVYQQPPQK